MTGAQDPAADSSQVKACQADREQMIETLKEAFVQGRLTKDELGARVGQALTARTAANLAALSADTPASAGSACPPIPARRRPLARAIAGSGGCLIVGFAALMLSGRLDHTSPNPYSWSQLCLAVAILAIAVAPLIGTLAAATGYKKPRAGTP